MATLQQKIGQSFIIGISGKSLTEEEKKFIVDSNIGGIVLFARNIESPQQLHQLTSEIQALRFKMPDKVPLLIGIDMEGGRVARLKAPFTQWPPLRKLGDIDSPALGFKFAEMMGAELRAIGINLDFAPCIDIHTNPKNEIIGDRSLGGDAEHVAKMASSLVRGYIKSGILPCVKHFPGHGNTLLDSHFELPIENISYEILKNRELIPFKKSFRARVDLTMTAHILFPDVDPDWPVTLSEKFMNEVLRNECGYRGLIMTDDLDMKALRNRYKIEEIAVRAVHVGANILLYCNEPQSPILGLEAIVAATSQGQLDSAKIDHNYSEVLKLKKSKLKNLETLPINEVSKIVGHPDHLALSKAIQAGEVPAGLAT